MPCSLMDAKKDKSKVGCGNQLPKEDNWWPSSFLDGEAKNEKNTVSLK